MSGVVNVSLVINNIMKYIFSIPIIICFYGTSYSSPKNSVFLVSKGILHKLTQSMNAII